LSWLGWATPAWLAALSALAVPIAIHLLSRGRQRRLAVGSVAWMSAAETVRARRLRLSRWWLLLLRCLVLATVIAALAVPRWALPAKPSTGRWLLLGPEVLPGRERLERANPEAYQRLDALRAAGAELRWLVPGLPVVDGPPPVGAAAAGDWSLVREADAAAPVGIELVVVTVDRAAALGRSRPSFERRIEWLAMVDPGANRWLERVQPLAAGRAAVFVGSSDGAGTRYQRHDLALTPSPTADGNGSETVLITSRRQADGWQLTLADGGTQSDDDSVALLSTSGEPRVAVVYASERAEDARYLLAGLEAVRGLDASRFALDPVALDAAAPETSAAASEARQSDLLFWLSPDALPPGFHDDLGVATTLVSDAGGRFESCDCRVRPFELGPGVQFDRLSPVAGVGQLALWSTAGGRPVLTAELVAGRRWLRLHSRFHPSWTDLVFAAAFPRWLATLLAETLPPPVTARRATSDRRAAPGQAPPLAAVAVDDRPRREAGSEPWLWCCAAALLALERRLAAGRTAGKGAPA